MLSVALAVRNEEKNIGDWLHSIQAIADEIVVVDSGSDDRTVEIAKKFDAIVVHANHDPMFHKQKQLALETCTNDWILQLDADERVTPALVQQIKDVISGKTITISNKDQKLFDRHFQAVIKSDPEVSQQNGPVRGYCIPRKNYFLGGYLLHAGVYPDGVIRLVQKKYAHFPCKSVHEQIQIDGAVAWLSAPLLHLSDPTFARYLDRADRYTTQTAQHWIKSGMCLGILNTVNFMFVKPVVVFLLLFIRHKGFLDGFRGFVWSLFSGLHYAIAYMKVIEHHLKKDVEKDKT